MFGSKKDIKVGVSDFVLEKMNDKYVGEYVIRADKKLYRQGKGEYITHDGQKYEGIWQLDMLSPVEVAKISYKDGSFYEGCTENMCYQNLGKYILPDKSEICCEFNANKLVGLVTVTDPNGYKWEGTAENNNVVLKPLNLFYFDISQNLGRISRSEYNESED